MDFFVERELSEATAWRVATVFTFWSKNIA
ncbi:hypothetical protein GGE46_005846 [Rhizobium etli]|uniref:Uncharacterized protein n=1 Tax=Rhizobium etli TaxID=29449 RepID=A0A7W6ZNW7_RHIET|nr:hypothetical protein [Rhizobium etli]MBB4539054.1 hypothetical protein [Rhizobium etli]